MLSDMCFIVIDSTHAAAEMNPVRTTKYIVIVVSFTLFTIHIHDTI